jgi:DNA-binding phage protein
MAAMGKSHKAKNVRRTRDELTVSHRERLVEELRADPKLAADYLNEAAEDSDARVYLAALRTVAGRLV